MARTRGPREAAHSVAGQQEGDGPRVWRLEPRLKNGATAAIYAVRPRAARKVAEPQLGGACAPARAARDPLPHRPTCTRVQKTRHCRKNKRYQNMEATDQGCANQCLNLAPTDISIP